MSESATLPPHGAPHDPATHLTPAERKLVAWLNANKNRQQVLTELAADLQLALQVELATIPIYLFAYYSLQRNNASGVEIDHKQAYTNKAAGVIMSVAVEEMLHMSLVANLIYAMGGTPQLYGNAPKAYPTTLPGHKPTGPKGPGGGTSELIPLAGFSFEQLWNFLKIEYPELRNAMPQDANWETIGQLYSYVRCLVSTQFLTDADFQLGARSSAIQPGNYSPNNVDTIYPSGKFDPWKPAPPSPRPSWGDGHPSGARAAIFPSHQDSHAGPSQLMTIGSRRDALLAIDTICDQGEGYPVPHIGLSAFADLSKRELSHYMKFLTLQAQLGGYANTRETLPAQPLRPAPVYPTMTLEALVKAKLVVPFPTNPTVASYPSDLQPIAVFCNALFQYMLIMTETVFRVPPANQKRFFNESLHRSMIWVLDKYIQTMRNIQLPSGNYMAPTFEFANLGPPTLSYTALTSYAQAAVNAAVVLAASPLTPPSLVGVYQSIIYYAAISPAVNVPSGPSSGPFLADVSLYWSTP
jgi:hypothetical protein